MDTAMRTQRWCLILSIFLALVKSEIYDETTESFYESQFSSPSPSPLPSTAPDSAGLKEVVLYLTPEQVHALRAAGALVQPFPELGTRFPNKDQYQLNLRIQNTSEVSSVSPKQIKKSNLGLENYYMLFNIQEINDNLALLPQTVEVTTKIPTTTPRHKYMKTRNRNRDKEYHTASNAKKTNPTKTMNQNSNPEYVRFLPNYEKNNNLKMTPFRALPIIPYHVEPDSSKAFIQSNNKARTNSGRYSAQRIATLKPPIISTQTARNEVTKSIPLRKATFAPLLLHTPVHQRQSKQKAFKETPTYVENLPPQRKQQFNIETTVKAPATVKRSRLILDKLALLLAPLYQHRAITEAISQQKEESLREEGKIKPNLPQIIDAPHQNDQQYTTEKEKITTDLVKQNTLAVIEAVSTSPPDLIKIFRTQDSKMPKVQEIGGRVPNEKKTKPAVSIPTSVLVRSEPFDLPPLYPVTLDITRTVSVQKPKKSGQPTSFDITRGIPVPILEPFKVDIKNFVQIPLEQRVPSMTRNVFVEKQILIPKPPVSLKHDVTKIVPIQVQENLTIIRPIWEH